MKACHILSLDDDDNFNMLLEKKFNNNTFKITTSGTVKAFFEHFTKNKWDICLVDINLAEGNDAGFEVIRLIREKFNSEIPIIILSRNDESEKIIHGTECGANDYLTKPLDMDMFMAKIKYLLDESVEINNMLKTSAVPSSLRQCTISTTFKPGGISEDGITLVGPNCLSKGTMVEISGSKFNQILEQEKLKLMVTRNSKTSENTYSVFLEFGEENLELIQRARSWIISKKSA